MEESNFYDLRKQVVQQLRERHYAPLTICAFKSSYNKLECYMLENKIEIYSARVGEDFLKTRHKGMAYAQLSDFEKNMVRHIKIMNEVLHTGIIIGKPTPRTPMFEFKGDLGIQFNEFICHERRIKSPLTVSKHHLYLRDLYDFLKENNKLVKEFGIPDCLLFLRELKRKKRPWHHVVSSVRAFVRYSCERNLLADCNFSRWDRILCLHRPKNPQLPSYYSREEIKKMLDAIDRSCPKGKRDYAMLLLAARYGLRASDIVGITYANFEWEFNRLSLVQAKTGKPVSYPLSEEIGSAIIDYIKFGRPDIDSPHVFLEHMAPYQRISPQALSRIVSEWMLAARIDISTRKHGPHSLRHSLAINLFENGESPSVISEILGHSNLLTTMSYVKVDLKHLRQCALEVPQIPEIFYLEIYEKENW